MRVNMYTIVVCELRLKYKADVIVFMLLTILFLAILQKQS